MTKIPNSIVVLSPEKIKQKLAGHLANYNRRLNSTTDPKERKAIEANRDSYMKSCEEKINEQNRKAIQRRAGYLSWETRRRNEASAGKKSNSRIAVAQQENASKTPRRRYGSAIDVRVVSVKKK